MSPATTSVALFGPYHFSWKSFVSASVAPSRSSSDPMTCQRYGCPSGYVAWSMTKLAWPYGRLSTPWRFSFLTTCFSFATTSSVTVLMKKPSLSASAHSAFSRAPLGTTSK